MSVQVDTNNLSRISFNISSCPPVQERMYDMYVRNKLSLLFTLHSYVTSLVSTNAIDPQNHPKCDGE